EIVSGTSKGLARVLEIVSQTETRTDEDLDKIIVKSCDLNHKQILPPVFVIWDGRARHLYAKFPVHMKGKRMSLTLNLENGAQKQWDISIQGEVRLNKFVKVRLPIPGLPLGYHKIIVKVESLKKESLIIS